MIIDGHTHVWPDHVAAKALAGNSPDLEIFGDGTVRSLLSVMDRAGVDKSICLGVATTPERVDTANAFAASLDPTRFIGFGSVHARLDPEENVASLRRHGLIGAKVHPLFQGYALDDPGLLATFERMQGEFAVIVHVGAGGHAGDEVRCTPEMLREVVRLFPRLDVIACHFGGYQQVERAEEVVIGLPVYLDTSWPPSIGTLGVERVRDLVLRHGAERVIFASDWPTADPAGEIAAIRALGLSSEETDAILGGNLERVLADVASRRAA